MGFSLRTVSELLFLCISLSWSSVIVPRSITFRRSVRYLLGELREVSAKLDNLDEVDPLTEEILFCNDFTLSKPR